MESLTLRASAQQKEAIKPTAVPHSFVSATADLIHAIYDPIKRSDCGIAGDPGTEMALFGRLGRGEHRCHCGRSGLDLFSVLIFYWLGLGRTGPEVIWWGLGNNSSKSEGQEGRGLISYPSLQSRGLLHLNFKGLPWQSYSKYQCNLWLRAALKLETSTEKRR